MPKTADVIIDGAAHTVQELRPRENAAWRQRAEAELEGLLTLVGTLPDVELERPEDLVGLFRQAAPAFLGAVGQVHALCVAYDGAFEAAYESEALDAFPEVLALAYPFAGLVERAQSLFRGLGAGPISVSSRGPSGDSGTTS